MLRSAARSSDAGVNPGAVRMRKTRKRRRKNLCLVTVEVPLNAYESAKRGDFAGITSALDRDASCRRRICSNRAAKSHELTTADCA
jgi:hypothetical protein